jgi:hypothetical protein
MGIELPSPRYWNQGLTNSIQVLLNSPVCPVQIQAMELLIWPCVLTGKLRETLE